MKALPRRKGNHHVPTPLLNSVQASLNESPSQKEGKSTPTVATTAKKAIASMKALPRRKGNGLLVLALWWLLWGLNESPSQKEGKFFLSDVLHHVLGRLNESPSQKEGKCKFSPHGRRTLATASMKALPRRKGNSIKRRWGAVQLLSPQ